MGKETQEENWDTVWKKKEKEKEKLNYILEKKEHFRRD